MRKTAKQLNISLSSVSRRVKNLEEALGVTLFIKKNRGEGFTQDADLIVASLLEDYNNLKYKISQLNDKVSIKYAKVPFLSVSRAIESALVAQSELSVYTQEIQVENINKAIDQLLIGDLDFLIDIKYNHSNSITSNFIKKIPVHFVSKNKKYLEEPTHNYGKMTWMNENGPLLKEGLGIESMEKTSFSTLYFTEYINRLLLNDSAIGLLPIYYKEVFKGKLYFSENPAFSFNLYLIQKKNLSHKKKLILEKITSELRLQQDIDTYFTGVNLLKSSV